MREFTKSMTSFSWALSLFGLKQMANIVTPAQQGRSAPATDAFNEVAQCAEEQLGQTLRATFEAGDRLQRGAVDVMFGFFLWPLDPRAWGRMAPGEGGSRGGGAAARNTGDRTSGDGGSVTGAAGDAWRAASDAMRGAADAMRGATQPRRGSAGDPEQRRSAESSAWREQPAGPEDTDGGWGPVPPPGGWTSDRGRDVRGHR